MAKNISEKELLLLERKNQDWEALFEAIKTIHTNLDLNEALDEALLIATNLLGAKASSLLLVNENNELEFKIAHGEAADKIKHFKLKMGEGIAGWVAKEAKPVLIEDCSKDPRFQSNVDKKTGFETKSMICVPLITRGRVIGVIQVINKRTGDYFDQQDCDLLLNFSYQAATVIENARLYEKIFSDHRESFEIDIASGMQRSLLPTVYPSSDFLEIAAMSTPSKNVGGDYYDCLKTDNGISTCIASTTAFGLNAAIIMTVFRSAWRSLVLVNETLSNIAKSINSLLAKDISGTGISVTGCFTFCNGDEMEIMNIGHPAPFFLSNDKKSRLVQPSSGITLGESDYIDVSIDKLSWEKGSILVNVSQGISNILAAKLKDIGPTLDYLTNLVKNTDASDAATLADNLFMEICAQSQSRDFADDISLMVLAYPASS